MQMSGWIHFRGFPKSECLQRYNKIHGQVPHLQSDNRTAAGWVLSPEWQAAGRSQQK